MYKASVRKTGFEFDKPPTLGGKFVRFHAERRTVFFAYSKSGPYIRKEMGKFILHF